MSFSKITGVSVLEVTVDVALAMGHRLRPRVSGAAGTQATTRRWAGSIRTRSLACSFPYQYPRVAALYPASEKTACGAW